MIPAAEVECRCEHSRHALRKRFEQISEAHCYVEEGHTNGNVFVGLVIPERQAVVVEGKAFSRA